MIKYILLLCLLSISLSLRAEINLYSQLSPAQAKADLEQWLTFLENTHPQLSYTVENVEHFYNKVEEIKDNINHPITVREFWKRATVLNSMLNDGHTVIKLPKMKSLTNRYIQDGGSIFPFEIVFDDDDLIIKSGINGKATPYRGHKITHINGRDVGVFVEPLLVRTNGDSDKFRKALLQRQFATYIWLYYGEIESFDLTLLKSGQIQSASFAASRDLLQEDLSFDEQFNFKLLDDQNALLTLNTFYWGAKYKDVIDFLHTTFAIIAKSNIQHLIIDIRENGGGDDGIWIDGILPYIADKTWRTGSKFKVKVLPGRADEGEKVGDVVDGENRFREAEHNANFFNGDVSVLISGFTYSSSILFANVIQDHNFGLLVGEATGGKSGQTGGTQALSLNHSNLRVVSPFFYLERPKGGNNLIPVQPDIAIGYDKTLPEQLIYKLINKRKLSSLSM